MALLALRAVHLPGGGTSPDDGRECSATQAGCTNCDADPNGAWCLVDRQPCAGSEGNGDWFYCGAATGFPPPPRRSTRPARRRPRRRPAAPAAAAAPPAAAAVAAAAASGRGGCGGRPCACGPAAEPAANCWAQRCCDDPSFVCFVAPARRRRAGSGGCPKGWACDFASARAPSLHRLRRRPRRPRRRHHRAAAAAAEPGHRPGPPPPPAARSALSRRRRPRSRGRVPLTPSCLPLPPPLPPLPLLPSPPRGGGGVALCVLLVVAAWLARRRSRRRRRGGFKPVAAGEVAQGRVRVRLG